MSDPVTGDDASPSDAEPTRSETDTTASDKPDRGTLIGRGLIWVAKWSLILVAIGAGATALAWVIAKLWVILLPIALATIVATVLWPPTRVLRNKLRFPPALAAFATLLIAFLVFVGIIAGIVPSIIAQAPDLADRATDGINRVQDWLHGPPLNLDDDQLNSAVDTVVNKVQQSGSTIASGVFSGVTTASSVAVTLVMVLVLTFFMIKDGPRLLPFVNRIAGRTAGRHISEVATRMWNTLGGFIRTQALVSLIDAVGIGLGLVILGVPLWPVLAIITFIGGFIPIIGAFVAGALAVLVALVANGVTTAIIVLVIILAVQQLEGNVLQPLLQSKSMELHATIVLLAVTAGGSLYGIVGAFLAVPVTAVAAVGFRYLNEQIDNNTAQDDLVESDESQVPPPVRFNPRFNPAFQGWRYPGAMRRKNMPGPGTTTKDD